MLTLFQVPIFITSNDVARNLFLFKRFWCCIPDLHIYLSLSHLSCYLFTLHSTFLYQLITLVEKTLGFKPGKVDMYETPYGVQLNWPRKYHRDDYKLDDRERLKEGLRFTIHLKDNHKVRT